MLSDFQKRKFTYYFRLWDIDGNGYMEFWEYLELLHRVAALKRLPEGAEEYKRLYRNTEEIWIGIQQYADTDNDGRVSLDEWLVYCEASMNYIKDHPEVNQSVPMGDSIFEAMDSNQDGFIEADSWHIFVNLWQMKGEPLELFRVLDVDGDGKIDRAEFGRLQYEWIISDNPDDPGNLFFGEFE